uniref:ORF17 n=1 Tax=Nitrosopumilaceae spindle-shaped virus TaxID=3065433 RepID=A0AAT9JAA2_9VIRU
MEITLDCFKRFMIKIEQNGNCWQWIASKDPSGYGKFMLNKKLISSHRISYELFKGEIPKGLQIDHLCRNRACVNPEHMEVVTQKENLRRGDKTNIGRNNRLKTHCPQGHEYIKENLVKSDPGRKCKICKNARDRILSKKRYYKLKGLN